MIWSKKRQPNNRLPPDQVSIPRILNWGVDHPGITRTLPDIKKGEWKLTVDGEVEFPLSLSWGEFLALPQADSISDFHCVEGWSVLSQHWSGVLFKTIHEKAHPRNAEFAWFECADGYTTSLPLADLQGDNVIIAHRLNGEELQQSLGGPVRLVVPDKYAYKSPMWLTRITFSNRDKLGFWERGYYSNTTDVSKNDRYRSDA